MGINRGKQFEGVIKDAFLKIPDVSIDRLHDQMTGYKITSANICDFIVYRKPTEYYIECKSVHGNTMPFSNVSDNQWRGLLEKSKIKGVKAGIICWWIDKDVTLYIPIQTLETMKNLGKKSVRYDEISLSCVKIQGTKKRVFFEYDMEGFFNEV